MKESGFQTKLMNTIKREGGWCVNGAYTLAGEADLQCGIPIELYRYGVVLVYVAVEVKTDLDYHRVMRAVDVDYNVIDSKKLKKHEVLQMAKIRGVRKRGGLALVAYNYKQVMEYIDERFDITETNT